MRDLLARYRPVFAPEGGTGAGDGGGDGGGGGGFAYPEGFPDQFKGATIEESFGKLFGGYTETHGRMEGLRTKLAGLPHAPEKPEAYTYTPSEKLKPWFSDIDKSPVFAQARTAFHKHGVPQEAFAGIIEDLYAPLAEQGLLAAPYDPAAEVRSFMEHTGLDKQHATEALTNADAFAKGLSAQLSGVPEKLKPDVDALLLSLTDSAAGNVLLRAISGRLAESGIRIGGTSTMQGQLTEADLKKLDGDPRIDPANRDHTDPAKRYDPELRRRYEDAYVRLAPANTPSW